MNMKFCGKCKRDLSTECFRVARRQKDGLFAWCRECESEYKKEYQKKNKERIVEYRKEYHQNNREHILEKNKLFRENNKESVAEYQKEYYINNKNKLSEYKKVHYKKNKSHYAEYLRCYYKSNKDKFACYKNKRESLKRQLPSSLTKKEWDKIKRVFNDKCAYCGTEDKLTQDHFLPLSKGGEYTHNNIIPACKSCNCSKRASSFFEWYPNQDFYSKTRERKILKHLRYNDNTQQLSIL